MSPACDATLVGVIGELTRRGFTENFSVVGDHLRALGSGETFKADEVAIREFRRFEGVSDPDDMAIVYALETRSGARGILVDAFGVYASPAISRFLDSVPIPGSPRATA